MDDPAAGQGPAPAPPRVGIGWTEGPFLTYPDGGGERQFVALQPGRTMTLGRGAGCDVQLGWDEAVSRVHAQLEPVGRDWTLVDDGLSRNGTYLNGERLTGRKRLRDGDTFVLGGTSFTYRSGQRGRSQETKVADGMLTVGSLSPTQRQVLTALCRPYRDSSGFATPASNQQIAGELYLSVDAVKTHLRTLFQKFHIEDLPQNQKRAKLVERAFALGIVSRRDL